MAVPKHFETEKGTLLPLLNLRGKPYLTIAQRLVWLDERFDRYTIDMEYLKLEEDYAVAQSTVTIFDNEGNVLRKATSAKKETQKDFPDFVEKAGTGACGRALACIGIGTQFCIQDLDEGNRLADAPVPIAEKADKKPAAKKKSSFSTVKKEDKPETTTESNDDGWE